MPGLGPILGIGIPSLIGIVFFIYCKVTLDGKKSTIVVVDRRTMKLAARRITEALAETPSDYTRAHAGLTALTIWLDAEIKTGPRRHRAEYAKTLASAQATKSVVAAHLLAEAL